MCYRFLIPKDEVDNDPETSFFNQSMESLGCRIWVEEARLGVVIDLILRNQEPVTHIRIVSRRHLRGIRMAEDVLDRGGVHAVGSNYEVGSHDGAVGECDGWCFGVLIIAKLDINNHKLEPTL